MIDHGNNLRKLALLDDDDPPAAKWLWKGYFAPGTLTVISAGYKAGKSTLMTLLYDAMRSGGTLAGEPVAKGIVQVASEEPKAVWRVRKKKFNLEGHVEVDIRPFPPCPSHVRWEEYVASFKDKPADLCVFDSSLHFLPENAECNKSSFHRAIEALRPLTEVGRAVALLHQPAKRRNDDFNFRGYGAVDGDPEVFIEIKRLTEQGSNDRQRIIQVRSRLDYTPPRRMVELNPEGTVLTELPMPVVDGTFETGWAALEFLLEDARERMTVTDIFTSWLPDFWKPSLITLRRWLDQAVRENRLEKFGTGKRNSPFRYALPGKRFNPFGLNDADIPDIRAMDYERYGY